MSSATSNSNNNFIITNVINPTSTSPVTNNNPSSSSRPSSSTQPTAQACAACKYQRRKCNPDCILAPYFPADQPRQFLNAHRLFGVSNILKIIRGLDQHNRNEAMKSIIFQSNARAHDPVGGCYRFILDLQRQIDHDSAELALVLRQLAMCRAQAEAAAAAAAVAHNNLPLDITDHSNLLLNSTEDGEDSIYGGHYVTLGNQQQQYYDYFYYDGDGVEGNENDQNENNNNNESNSYSVSINDNGNNNGLEMGMLSLQQKGDDEDVKPLVDMFEVRETFTIADEEEEVSKEVADVSAFHCSTKTDLKDEQNPMEHVQEHDLKGAASFFTLTNYNNSAH